jgi:hypothetical protein
MINVCGKKTQSRQNNVIGMELNNAQNINLFEILLS